MNAPSETRVWTERRTERRLTGWQRRTGWHPGSVERRKAERRAQQQATS